MRVLSGGRTSLFRRDIRPIELQYDKRRRLPPQQRRQCKCWQASSLHDFTPSPPPTAGPIAREETFPKTPAVTLQSPAMRN